MDRVHGLRLLACLLSMPPDHTAYPLIPEHVMPTYAHCVPTSTMFTLHLRLSARVGKGCPDGRD